MTQLDEVMLERAEDAGPLLIETGRDRPSTSEIR